MPVPYNSVQVQPSPEPVPLDILNSELQDHIADPIDAHQVSAIGQIGYAAPNATWAEAAAGIGGTQNAITTLFNAVNARPIWVLDANPLNEADFVGPDALIDAVAAAGTYYPQIFLRPGTYDWDDNASIDNFTIIGGRKDTTIIQNLTGDLRIGANATLKNLTIHVGGSFSIPTADPNSIIALFDCIIQGYSVGASSTLFIDTEANVVLERVYAVSLITTNPSTIRVTNSRNVVANDCVFEAGNGKAGQFLNSATVLTGCEFIGGSTIPNAGNQLFSGYGSSSLIAPNNPTAPMVLRNCTMEYGSSNCNPLAGTGTGQPVIFFGGSDVTPTVNHGPAIVDGLNVSPGSSVAAVGGQHRDGLLFIDITSQVLASEGGSYKDIAIDVEEKTWAADALGRTNPGGSVVTIFGMVDTFSTPRRKAKLENFSLVNVKESTGIVDRRGMIRCQGVVIDGLLLTGPTTHGTDNFAASAVTLRNCTATNVAICADRGIQLGDGGVALVVQYLDLFESTVTNSIVNASVFDLSSNFTSVCRLVGSSLRNVTLTQDLNVMIGAGLEINAVGSTAPCHVSDVVLSINASNISASSTKGIEVLTVSANVLIENVKVTANQQSIADYETLRIINSQAVTVRDATFTAGMGRAGHVNNSGATLERVKFIGGSFLPVGTQLFTGWGHDGTLYPITPLVLRNCEMEYGSSNCAAPPAGHPTIFFGGILGASVANRGPVNIDGLSIRPGSSVTAIVGQPRNTLLAISASDASSNTVRSLDCYFDNISIDLNNIPWTTSGLSRSTLIPSPLAASAAVVEIAGFRNSTQSHIVGATCANLRITGIQEGAISDSRYILNAEGVKFENIVILGPNDGVAHGAGGFTNNTVSLGQCIVRGLILGTNTTGLPKLTSGTYLSILGSHITEVVIGVIPTGAIYQQLVRTSTARLSGTASLLTSKISKLQCSSVNVAPTGDLLSLSNGCQVFEVCDLVVTSILPGNLITLGDDCHVHGNSLRSTSATNLFVNMTGDGASFYGNRIQGISSVTLNCSGDGNAITGNTLKGTDGFSAIFIDVSGGAYNSVTGNTLWNTSALSPGAAVDATGTGNLEAANTLRLP